MNRKNLTAAVLAGLAGAAGIAGTAQAVNMNPDGLGQVLIYPYYTTNGDNQTLLSVVNTTENAKAVKVRFLEGYNSREVLDFNLYMSHEDVWTAALIDGDAIGETAGTPYLVTFDTSCTVPYLYESGPQEFLKIAYNDNGKGSDGNYYNFADGGPTGIERAAEGHFEIIEMGTIYPSADTNSDKLKTWTDITHAKQKDETWMPGSCDNLSANWTRKAGGAPGGAWTCASPLVQCSNNDIDISRNSGGLFGGASVVNGNNGTMYSYNAQAIQGYDRTANGNHWEPGTIHPSLDDGDQNYGGEYVATVFFGVPQNRARDLYYFRSVDAVTALFMHENIMNEYTVEEIASASTEWVITFPTKNFYVDPLLLFAEGSTNEYWFPAPNTPDCGFWDFGDQNPAAEYNPGGKYEDEDPNTYPSADGDNEPGIPGWTSCTFLSIEIVDDEAIAPFTGVFDGEACETVSLQLWDREERTPSGPDDGPDIPPSVSPSLPCIGDSCSPEDTPFQLCYETNVLRFGDGVIFDTPEIEGDSLLLTVNNPYENGWGRIDLHYPAGQSLLDDSEHYHMDMAGLLGLPATGFAAFEFENNFLAGENTKAFYGGIFGHRGNVRRLSVCNELNGGRFCRFSGPSQGDG